jgi:RHS repeat-associated protein
LLDTAFTHILAGMKKYELTNHLGNVLSVITDRRLYEKGDDGSQYYVPDVVSATDYYPFGWAMPGRTYTAASYKYGFNGKENDNEVKGEGNQQDYGMRIYDPRLGRFLSVDPITAKFPMLTPYQFASNSPILGVDMDGLEFRHYPKISDKAKIILNGAGNVIFGVGATIGSGYYIVQTGGAGAALGGATAMSLSLGEVAIGFAQISDGFANNKPNPILQSSNSIPGLVAYNSGSKYAPFIDAAGGFIPGSLSGGNFKGLAEAGIGVYKSTKNADLGNTILNSLQATDAILDIINFGSEALKIPFTPFTEQYVNKKSSSNSTNYTIKSGETLSGIAKKFNTNIETIAKNNHIQDVDKIKEGQILRTE